MGLLRLQQLLLQPQPLQPQPLQQQPQLQRQQQQLALQLLVKTDVRNNKLNMTMESKQELFAALDLAHGCPRLSKNWTSQRLLKENNGLGNRGASTPTVTTAFQDLESTIPLRSSQPNKPLSTETPNADENSNNKSSNITLLLIVQPEISRPIKILIILWFS